MKWFFLIFSILFILFTYMFMQALLYKTRYYTMPSKIGYRFLHLSDIHIGLLFVSAKRLKKTIRRVDPDSILISGDFLDHPKHLKKLEMWLKELQIHIPVYAVLGNHDHQCFKKFPAFQSEFMVAMEHLNIQILVNEAVPISDEIALIGIDDCKRGALAEKKIFTRLKEQYKYVLAFSHNPDVSLYIPDDSVDLLITGHLHGGQMWMPFHLEYLLFRKDKMCKMGHYKGFASIRGNKMYISRGLGTVLFPFRFFSVPEVTVFTI